MLGMTRKKKVAEEMSWKQKNRKHRPKEKEKQE